jgi:hypothetical protein
MGKTQLGGVRGDWFKDLYHREEAEASGEAIVMGRLHLSYNLYVYIE